MEKLFPRDSDKKKSRNYYTAVGRGQNAVAASASIPSKYQTIVIRNDDKKGFNQQAKRFNYDFSGNHNPGPAAYNNIKKSAETQSTSFSKKGTGSFASSSRRYIRRQNQTSPSAAEYNLPSLLITRNDFHRSNTTSSFQKPIAKLGKDFELIKRSKLIPAPNTYNVNFDPVTKKYIIGAQPAFRSNTKRDGIPLNNVKNPSPCHYNIHDSITKKTTHPLASVFASTTQRAQSFKKDVPGPGSYKPYQAVTPPDKLTMPRKHYLCLSAPAIPLPEPNQEPGPGSYDIVDYDGPEKHYMSSGVFVSNTSRWNNEFVVDKSFPGPATYKPSNIGKQSFIYNVYGRWVPI